MALHDWQILPATSSSKFEPLVSWKEWHHMTWQKTGQADIARYVILHSLDARFVRKTTSLDLADNVCLTP
jgi:hypothetical protein